MGVLVLSAVVWAGAVSFYGNQSDISWKSAETDHFRFHYPAEYQDQASKIVSFAEAVHDSVTLRYRVKLPGRVDMVIRNSLFSNGLASPISNTMNIWLTDWDFRIRSTHNWLSDVVTHEFSHLVSMQSASKLSPYIHGLQFTWQDYYNEPVQNNISLLYPFLVYPLWFAEGTAQYESSRMGFDSWDTHRDMILRTSVLADSLLPLEQMRDFPDNALGSEAGPYNQGFNLVLYIAERFGDRAIPNLWSEMSRLHRVTFTEACRQVLGISEEQLYKDWKLARLDHYTRQKDSSGVLREGKKRSREAFWQDMPQLAGGVLWGVSNMGSEWFEGSLFQLPMLGDSLKSYDSLPAGKRPDSVGTFTMASFAENPFHLVKPWLEKGFSVRYQKDHSPTIAYVSYQNRDRDGKAYFDIAVDDTSESPWFGERKSLRWATHFADAVFPDLSPDGSEVVFVRRERNGSRFFLSLAKVPPVGASSEEWMDLRSPPDSARYFGVYSPKWSPDGKRIAFGFYDGESRKIAIIDKDGKNYRVISGDGYDSRDPAWTPEGNALVFSSDRNGIFNLYRQEFSVDSLMGESVPLTNVLGGAFAPAVDSANLWYVGYDPDGFSLYELSRTDSARAAPQGKKIIVKPETVSMGSIELQGVQRPYRALPIQPILVPMLAVEGQADALGSLRKGVVVPMGGAAIALSDPLQKNFLQLALLLELGKGFDFVKTTGLNPAKQSQFLVMAENRSFPITLGAGYMRQNTTSRDTVRSEDPRAETPLSVTQLAIGMQALEGSAGYSVFKKGDSLIVGAGMQWANFNLYQEGFAWDYHKQQHLSATLRFQTAEENGNGASLSFMSSRSWLFRPGTFQESFTINSQGVISPVYRRYALQQAWLAGWYGIESPLQAGARLIGSVQSSGILAWSGQSTHTDTLDHFYHHSLDLAGYPTLLESENLLLHGDRTAVGQLHYLFPLYQDLNATWWIFTAKDFHTDVYAQIGSAWWDGSSILNKMNGLDAWKRSVGFEFRFTNSIFMNQPLDVWVNFARALDRVQVLGVSQDVERVSLPWIPSVIEPTGISLGVGFQFNDPWLGSRSLKSPRI